VRFVEFVLGLLADRCFDVEHCEGRSNVEGQCLESEPPSRTYPITSPSRTGYFGYGVSGKSGNGEGLVVCSFQKSYLQDPLQNDPTSSPSGLSELVLGLSEENYDQTFSEYRPWMEIGATHGWIPDDRLYNNVLASMRPDLVNTSSGS
jgi:hypothetical protein